MYPRPPQHTARAAAYVVAGLLLFHLLYDRPDLLVGSLLLLSMALVIAGAHWAISLFVLALAVNFKLVPILVAPVFIIASVPPDVRPDLKRFLAAVAIRAAVLAAMCLGIFAPFLWIGGRGTLEFLHYHAGRGVHVESIPGNLLLLVTRVKELTYTHGAIDIVSPAAVMVGTIATGLTAIIVLAIAAVMLMRSRRRREDASVELAAFTLLTLTAAMSTSKVFSPQYLLWLAPLMPLIPPPRARRVLLLFLLACALTTAIFPYAYWSHLARPVVEPPHYAILPPTPTGLALLTLRNALFVVMVILLAQNLRRRSGPGRIEGVAAGG
jgi:hypothetical protein